MTMTSMHFHARRPGEDGLAYESVAEAEILVAYARCIDPASRMMVTPCCLKMCYVETPRVVPSTASRADELTAIEAPRGNTVLMFEDLTQLLSDGTTVQVFAEVIEEPGSLVLRLGEGRYECHIPRGAVRGQWYRVDWRRQVARKIAGAAFDRKVIGSKTYFGCDTDAADECEDFLVVEPS